ncbi:MAG: hypothetical protein LKE53_10030 [Oscillospiraceae bacterium]|nr:hypothetical protein [Oscillospiraceae bacterium]MDD3261749.1 hypothetical protein [Oscillospiraceae bacterium]
MKKLLLRKPDGSTREITERELHHRRHGGSGGGENRNHTDFLRYLLAALCGAACGCFISLSFPTYDFVGLPHFSASAAEAGLALGAAAGLLVLRLFLALWTKRKQKR